MRKSKEITIRNIENCGYRVGRSVRGKGIELFKADEKVLELWMNPEKDVHLAKKVIEKYGLENLYAQNIWFYDGDKRRHFKFQDAKTSQSQFNLQKLVGSGLKGVTEIAIYLVHPERIGYFPISKYLE